MSRLRRALRACLVSFLSTNGRKAAAEDMGRVAEAGQEHQRQSAATQSRTSSAMDGATVTMRTAAAKHGGIVLAPPWQQGDDQRREARMPLCAVRRSTRDGLP
jgi:hypothetical protein